MSTVIYTSHLGKQVLLSTMPPRLKIFFEIAFLRFFFFPLRFLKTSLIHQKNPSLHLENYISFMTNIMLITHFIHQTYLQKLIPPNEDLTGLRT